MIVLHTYVDWVVKPVVRGRVVGIRHGKGVCGKDNEDKMGNDNNWSSAAGQDLVDLNTL